MQISAYDLAFDVPADVRDRFTRAGIRIETREVARLVARDDRLAAVALAGGEERPCDVLFAHPPQRQVDLVRALGLSLDDSGFVRVQVPTFETSVAGIYAAGDLMTRMQAAILAAAYGTQAATVLNHELTAEQVTVGNEHGHAGSDS